jgi:hypothetical protein
MGTPASGGLYAYGLGFVRSLSNPFLPFRQQPLSAEAVREPDFWDDAGKRLGSFGLSRCSGSRMWRAFQAALIAWMSGWAPSMAIIRFRL